MGTGSKRQVGNISIHLYQLHDSKDFETLICQNVSPAAHAAFGIAVISCGIENYGITPRDSMSLGVELMSLKRNGIN